MNKARKILIPIDERTESDVAVDFALKNIINLRTDEIILVNVRPEVKNSSYAFAGHMAALYSIDYCICAFEKQLEIHSYIILRKKVKELKKVGANVRGIALRGEPGPELVWKINYIKPEVVVIGHRKRPGISQVFHESIADHLVKNIHYPVISVK